MASILTLKATKTEELMLLMLRAKETMQMANILMQKVGILVRRKIVLMLKEMRQVLIMNVHMLKAIRH
jgi:hypothetical protein